MYVDDGILFACGKTWDDITLALSDTYTSCADWLTRSGLLAEPEKTELLFFRKMRERVEPPHHIHLPISSHSTYYRVAATTRLRYLRFFLDHKLRWEPHVDIMCNRTRASLKGLALLGNSVRGLDFASWRLAYNAVCLPVLTYGCQLWYSGKQKTLINKLQVVQNEGIRKDHGVLPDSALRTASPVSKHPPDGLTHSETR
jgi:hypothetical protein